MNSRNIVLGLSALAGFALSTGVMATGCSSDNNPAPSNNSGVDASTGQDSATPDGTTGGNDTGTVMDANGSDTETSAETGTPDTGAAACDPTAYASDSGCTPCGTAALTACPLSSLGVICIPFDNNAVPDAGKL